MTTMTGKPALFTCLHAIACVAFTMFTNSYEVLLLVIVCCCVCTPGIVCMQLLGRVFTDAVWPLSVKRRWTHDAAQLTDTGRRQLQC